MQNHTKCLLHINSFINSAFQIFHLTLSCKLSVFQSTEEKKKELSFLASLSFLSNKNSTTRFALKIFFLQFNVDRLHGQFKFIHFLSLLRAHPKTQNLFVRSFGCFIAVETDFLPQRWKTGFLGSCSLDKHQIILLELK